MDWRGGLSCPWQTHTVGASACGHFFWWGHCADKVGEPLY